MASPFSAVVLTACLILAGCASSPGSSPASSSSSSGSASAPAAQAAPRIAPAVSVPPVSRRQVVLTMTGSKQVVDAKDWADFQREWRDTFADHAKQAGMAYRFADAEPKATGEDGTVLAVHVNDYRMVGIGARIFFGVMTGNAFIDAKVRFINLRDGTVFGEQAYSTTSSAWGGVFAKVTPQQVDSIATNVFLDLKPAP